MAGNALLHAEDILLATSVAPGMHVADFGVGRTGHLLFPAARIVGDQGKVYGVDIQSEVLQMIEGRRRQYLVHNIDLVQADFEYHDVAIPEHSLDRIFFVHTLAVAKHHRGVLGQIRRLLKPTGQVIVIDWHTQSSHPVAPRQEFRVHPNEIDLAFARGGCEVCGTFTPSPNHWGRMYQVTDDGLTK